MTMNSKIIFRIDEGLHNKFKAKCALKGKKMTEVLVKYIGEYVKENKQ